MTQHPPNMRDPNVASYRERMLHRPPARERSEKPRSELTLLALNAVMARPCEELAIAHGAQLPAERLLGDRDAELLEDPLCQIDQPPKHHAVDCRNRPSRSCERWLGAGPR